MEKLKDTWFPNHLEKINQIIDWINRAEKVLGIIDSQETGSAYVTAGQSSRSDAPQDVEIAQEKLGDVSGSEPNPANCPIINGRKVHLCEGAARSEYSRQDIQEIINWAENRTLDEIEDWIEGQLDYNHKDLMARLAEMREGTK